MADRIQIGLMGDVMLGRQVNERLKRVPSSYVWGDLLPTLKATDLNLINLECALTTRGTAVTKIFNFKADPQRGAQVLKEGNIHAVNLANNHVLDFGPQGLLETLETLDRTKILHVGAGKNLQEAKRPAIVEKNGIKIGIFGCTDNEPSWAATNKNLGVFYIDIATASLEKEISQLKSQVDLVILSIHWGPNLRQHPPSYFRTFAHRAVEQGVDILHGHSAHIFQGIETYQKGWIFYDAGDFIDDYAIDPDLRNDRSFLFLIEATQKGVKDLQLIPTIISEVQVNRAKEPDATAMFQKIRLLSQEFHTAL